MPISRTPECGSSVVNNNKIVVFYVFVLGPVWISFWRCFGSPNGGQKHQKVVPQNHSKTALISETPEIKNNATLPRFYSFLTFPALRKSSQNRCQNGFKIRFFLGPLLEAQKIRFSKLKNSQDGAQKFPKFL